MPPPSHPVLRKLCDLDRSLPGFHDQLSNVLYGEEYVRCTTNLQEDDLQWLVDFLDEVLNCIPHFSAASRKCLRELRSICGNRARLPTSYTLSSDLDVDPQPVNAGGFGDVHQGTLDGSLVCVKRVRLYSLQSPAKLTKIFRREAVMWKHLKHPNVVPLLGITIEPLQFISTWMPNGELLSYLSISNANRLVLLSDVAEGLCYLHSRNVIHGDLKGPNILVDDMGHAQITDFGLAKVTQNLDSIRNGSTQESGFTPRWTAPELLIDGTHSKEADIFSFAMVMVEVFTGAVPFSDKPATGAMFEIMNGKRPIRPTHPDFTAELWVLMEHCWNQDPCKRPEVVEVLSNLRGADRPTWRCLISDTLSTHERVSLIAMIFLDPNQVKAVAKLSGEDAQIFVDKINEVLDNLAPQIHKKCIRYLYKICGSRALLPKSLEIPICYDPEVDPDFSDELADVWRGKHGDRKVSAQVWRTLPGVDTKNIKERFCRVAVTWKALNHLNLLPLLGVTMTENKLVMVSELMLNENVMEFMGKNPNVDRLALLRGVTRGLIYMHGQQIVHGDLKGANFLIDNDGNARLAGFNMLTIASRQPATAPTPDENRWVQWMSPELLDPEKFGLKNNHPTVKSDIYALAMVAYQVLSGQDPFFPCRDAEVVLMVLEGERPKRPGGEPFTDNIWNLLELCWKQQPSERPTAKFVLTNLGGVLSTTLPPSDVDGEVETDADDGQSTVSVEPPEIFDMESEPRTQQSATHTESVGLRTESRSCMESKPTPSIASFGKGSTRRGTSKPSKVLNTLGKLLRGKKTGDVSQ